MKIVNTCTVCKYQPEKGENLWNGVCKRCISAGHTVEFGEIYQRRKKDVSTTYRKNSRDSLAS